MLALVLASAALTYIAQRDCGAIRDLPVWHRLLTGLIGYAAYILKTIWPIPLAPLYPNHVGMWQAWQVIGAAALIGGISWLTLRWRSERALLVGWLWYLGTLVPVLGIVQVGRQAMADRYMYFPLVGLSVLMLWGAELAIRNRPALRKPLVIVAIAVIVSWIPVTARQVELWRDGETLFAHALAVTSRNEVMENNYGCVLAEKGDIDAAMEHFRTAIEIRPDYGEAHGNLARYLLDRGRELESLGHFELAIKMDPEKANVRAHYARALRAAGRVHEAIQQYRIALQLDPDLASAWQNLGNALGSTGNLAEAIPCFQRALQIDPDYVLAHQNLALAYERSGRHRDAIRHLQRVLELEPENSNAAAALRRLGGG